MDTSHHTPYPSGRWRVRGKLKEVLHRLTGIDAVLPEPEYRRARVLAYMLLTLVFLLGLTLFLVLIDNRNRLPRRELYIGLITLLMIGLLVAYRLNRKGNRKASAYLTIACSIIGPWCSVFIDPAVLHGDFVPMTYIVLSILLTSMLLSARATIILSAIQFLLILLIPLGFPATATINWPSFMAFICFASLLGVVFNIINQQDLVQIYRQTSLLAESEARLRELSVRDPLTGLYNRRYMQEALERELLRAQQKHLPFSLLMIDMDNLKTINDTYGHSGGDEALRQIARAILKTSRNVDITCRYGGDEFTLILPEMSLDTAREYAEQLRRNVAETRVYCEDCLIKAVTFSVGVASYPQHGSSAEALLKAADSALYVAKHEGRNRVVALEMPISKEFVG